MRIDFHTRIQRTTGLLEVISQIFLPLIIATVLISRKVRLKPLNVRFLLKNIIHMIDQRQRPSVFLIDFLPKRQQTFVITSRRTFSDDI